MLAATSDGLRLWPLIEPEPKELRASRRRRDDPAKIMRVEQNRLEHAAVKTVRLSLQRHVRSMPRGREALDKRTSELMLPIKGIGPKTAAVCLAYLPELGSLTNCEAAAIVRLAPYAKESGTYQGHRHVSGERKDVRASL